MIPMPGLYKLASHADGCNYRIPKLSQIGAGKRCGDYAVDDVMACNMSMVVLAGLALALIIYKMTIGCCLHTAYAQL